MSTSVTIQDKTFFTSNLYPDVLYEPLEGTFWRAKKMRQYFAEPDENYRIRFYIAERNRQLFVKAIKLAWEISNDKPVPDNFVLYHKNLNENDFRLSNIACIHKSKYRVMIEALDNLNEHLKLRQHPDVPHYMILSYREDNRTKQRVIQDIVDAKKQYNKLLAKFVKTVGKYCSTD